MADEKEDKKSDKKDEKEAKKADKNEKESADGVEKKEGEEGAEGTEGEGGGKSKKKKLIIAAAALVVILLGAGAAVFMSGILGKPASEKTEGAEGGESTGEHGEEGAASSPSVTYYDMDEFLVNLNTDGKQTSFLKMKVTLEVPGEAEKSLVDAQMPRIKDSFQVYLRELRSSDLQGAGGMQRLREELLLRVNKIVYPAKVNDILFKEIIVQ